MSFASYSEFRFSVAAWLDWTDYTITHVNDLIQLGEQKLLKVLRVRHMETALAVTVNSSGQAAVPSDYIELKNVYLNTSPITPLSRVAVEELYRWYPNRASTSSKRLIAREAGNFILGGAGAEGDLVKGVYYAKPASVVTAATINSLFSAFPQCYLFAAVTEAVPFVGQDKRFELWQAKFSECVMLANMEDSAEGHSGSPPQMRLG